jgi:diguanylate cyclase (GGDEF)-like protein/PAS domain S-box-containing protein
VPADQPTEREPVTGAAEPAPGTTAIGAIWDVAVLVAMLLALVAAGIYSYDRDRARALREAMVDQLAARAAAELSQRLSALDAALRALGRDPDVLAAVRARDRPRLIEVATPLYRRLLTEQGVTHLFFYDVERTVMLRAHDPQRAFDRVSRRTLLAAEHGATKIAGIEPGAADEPVLRLVEPLFLDGRRIGYVEVGMALAAVLPELKARMDSDLLITVSRDRVDREQWERLRARNGLPVAWDELPGAVVLASTLEAMPDAMRAALSQPAGVPGARELTPAWLLVPVRLDSVRPGLDGMLYVLRGTSDAESAAYRKVLLAGMLLAAALFVAGTVLLLRHLRRDAAEHGRTVAARRRLEREVSERRHAQWRLSALSSGWYWEQDAALRYTEVSAGVARDAGIPAEHFLGRGDREVPGIEMPERFWDEHRATLAARRPFRAVELRVVGVDGIRRYVSVSGEPVYDARGRFRGYRGTGRSVTEQRAAEARLGMQREITALLAAAGPVHQTIEQVMRVVCDRLEFHCGDRRVLDAERGLLVREESVDDGSEALREFVRSTAGYTSEPGTTRAGPLSRAWSERAVVWIEDIEAATGFRRAPLALAAGLRSAVAFPVLSRGEPIAVFEFYSRLRQPEDAAAGAILESVGRQIGQFIERKCAEAALHLAGQAIESASESIVITDARGRVVDVNPAFIRSSGYSRAEVIGRRPRMLRAGRDGYARLREMARALRRDGRWQGEVWSRRRNGEVYPEWMSVVAVRDEGGRPTHYVAMSIDISERKAAEERLRKLANFDVLTDLPNRGVLEQQLERALAQAARNGRSLAVLFVDLDRFKFVNDSLGHEAGDRVLVETARRLRQCLRASDPVFRLGGDEFVVLLEETGDPGAVRTVAAKILSALSEPYRLDAQEFHLSASVGIANYPEDAGDRAGLLRCADLAMYRAKELGKNNYQFYSAQLNAQSVERMMLESALRHALERGEFDLAWQARVGIGDGRITGVEALLRWRHPELGVVSPGQFVPLAEETGLIVPIGDWAIEAACRQARRWLDAGLPPVRVAVNLSARQFEHETLVQTVGRLLDEYRLPPGTLELEITESLVMHNPEQAVRLLDELRRLGVSLSIDDFGTGYSSLAQLKRFPVDTLKIDRSFVQDLPDDAAITSAVVAMARSLRLRTVAEGVETPEQLEFLRRLGCDEIQGYLFSRPIPAEEFARLLERNREDAHRPAG